MAKLFETEWCEATRNEFGADCYVIKTAFSRNYHGKMVEDVVSYMQFPTVHLATVCYYALSRLFTLPDIVRRVRFSLHNRDSKWRVPVRVRAYEYGVLISPAAPELMDDIDMYLDLGNSVPSLLKFRGCTLYLELEYEE